MWKKLWKKCIHIFPSRFRSLFPQFSLIVKHFSLLFTTVFIVIYSDLRYNLCLFAFNLYNYLQSKIFFENNTVIQNLDCSAFQCTLYTDSDFEACSTYADYIIFI